MNNDISDHPDRHRFELAQGGEVAAHITYQLRGDVIDLLHTEVDPRCEGQGLASRLVKFALDDARARGRHVVASCGYVAAWIRKHPDYAPLLARQ